MNATVATMIASLGVLLQGLRAPIGIPSWFRWPAGFVGTILIVYLWGHDPMGSKVFWQDTIVWYLVAMGVNSGTNEALKKTTLGENQFGR